MRGPPDRTVGMLGLAPHPDATTGSELDMASRHGVIDGDGHVMEDDSVKDFIEPPYKGSRRLLGDIFPPGDTLHNEPVQFLPGARQDAGPKEWSAFLDVVGIDATVMYA